MGTKILKIDPEEPEPEKIEEAARVVRSGGLLAFPTDTVYGLGADVFNEKAVERVFKAKERSKDKPLSILVADFAEMESLVEDITPQALMLASYFWPGALTLVFKAGRKVPSLLTSDAHKVGIRIPDNKVALALIRATGTSVTGSSANLSGDIEPLEAGEVRRELGEKIELIIDGGRAKLGRPSTVVDISNDQPRVLRRGIISWRRVKEVLESEIE
ncbi:MAG: threonylcarbamoyl-AMP synthase [Nitrospirae bacterium]|nr:threonylcarbamoyl-AMP synthase [Nitrospirota bacterium]